MHTDAASRRRNEREDGEEHASRPSGVSCLVSCHAMKAAGSSEIHFSTGIATGSL